MPCAASVAENWLSAPSLTADARSASSCAPVAPLLALTADMAWSKSANRLTAKPTPEATAVPANAALFARSPNAFVDFGTSAFVRSSTDLRADRIEETKPSTFA